MSIETENTKDGKVAKIKAYLKLRLMDFFTAVFFFGVAFILYIKGDVDFSQVPTYSFVAEKQLPIAVIHMTGWGCVVFGCLAVAKAVLQTIVGCAMLVFGGSIHNNIVQPLEPKTECECAWVNTLAALFTVFFIVGLILVSIIGFALYHGFLDW